MIKMTYEDYISWANEYREQVKVVEKKLEEHRGKKRFATARERQRTESAIRLLYEMRKDCLETALYLEHIAKKIKEKERGDSK